MSGLVDVTETRARAGAVVMDTSFRERSDDLVDVSGEPWAARHNLEIWGTGPGGVYEAVTPPSDCASAMR